MYLLWMLLLLLKSCALRVEERTSLLKAAVETCMSCGHVHLSAT